MAIDITELLQSVGGGSGGGAILGGLLAKYFVNKNEKEIEAIKRELQSNKDADSIRDTAIELLKKETEYHSKSHEELKSWFKTFEEKMDKKLDQIFERINK